METIFVSLLIPFLLSIVLKSRSGKKIKERGVTIDAGGGDEAGIIKRNHRFLSLIETPWEGATTIAALFEQSCLRYASHPLLGTRHVLKTELVAGADGRSFEKLTLGEYKWLSYKSAFDVVCDLASGLAALGHRKDERCAIFAETRAEWFLSLQACFRRSISVVTVYASLGQEALDHSLNETEVSTVICDHKQFQKLVDMSHQLDAVKRVVLIEDEGNKDIVPTSVVWKVVSFAEVERLGREFPVEADLPAAADVAVIMYTSGSTGFPKGVMMTHGNLVATAAGVRCLIHNLSTKDKYLAYLPLAHVFELLGENIICAGGAAIGYGSPLTLTDTSNKIKKGTKGDASELKPTLLITVPAILDRIRDGIKKMIEVKGGLTRTVFELAYRRRLAAIEGSWIGAWGLEKLLWDALVFKNIRAILGGHVRGMLSGGAPLSADTQRFINVCFGIPVLQGYGLTETCAGGTFSEWNDNTVFLTGPPVPNCYIKLINWQEGGYKTSDKPFPRGEIIIGGPSVSLGYFKNQAKTDEVYKVDESGLRWFHTGDIGQFHPDGSLEIIDRKKDIVKLQHGEYVSLGKVEAILSACPYVESIMLHADPFRSYCVALVVVSRPAIESWAQKANILYGDFSDLCDKVEAVKEVLTALNKLGKGAKLDKFEIPLKIKLLHEPWTPEADLVTAALKLKRENLKQKFAHELKALYS